MPVLTPESFWLLYKQEIKERGSWSDYQKSASWTPIAILAAESVCHRFDFPTAREYFNIDVVAWAGTWDARHYNYDLRVAFEAEDSLLWEDELCKLAHVVTDLRVLVMYQSHLRRNAEDILDERLVLHRKRVIRDCNCKWLFIFGPHPRNRNAAWTAHSVDERGCRMPIVDDPLLRGSDMED